MVLVFLREPTYQLVVAGLRCLFYGGRRAMDVHPQTLVFLASLPALEPRICFRNDCRHAYFPRTCRLDTMGRYIIYYGRLLSGSKLRVES